MKINYSLIRILFALVIGLVLVCVPDKSAEYIVVTLGLLFLISGLVALLGHFISKSVAKKTQVSINTDEKEDTAVIPIKRFPIEAIGSVFLGIWFIVDPAFFDNLLTVVLSIILILGGLQQIVMLLIARKWKKAGFVFYIIPLIILFAGIYTLLNPNGSCSTWYIVIGATCLLYGVSELLNYFMFFRYHLCMIQEIKEEKE